MSAARQREYSAAVEGDKRAERARIDAENAEDERAERAAIAARIAAVNAAPVNVAPKSRRRSAAVVVKRPITVAPVVDDVDDVDDLTEREAIQAEATPSVVLLGATFARMRSGDWGARIVGDAKPGDIVRMVTRSGRASLRIVARVYWGDGATTLASLVDV